MATKTRNATRKPTAEGFTEYTFSNGECEFMAHESGGKWVHVYGYARNMPPGVRKTEPSKNPLFLYITLPLPETFVRSARARGFVCHDEAEDSTL